MKTKIFIGLLCIFVSLAVYFIESYQKPIELIDVDTRSIENYKANLEDELNEKFLELEEETYEDIENEDDISDVVWDAIYNMDDYDRVEAVFNGDMMISKLHRFIRSHRINDLHEGNWGCPVDGDSDELVIMDFAGYGF